MIRDQASFSFPTSIAQGPVVRWALTMEGKEELVFSIRRGLITAGVADDSEGFPEQFGRPGVLRMSALP
jgi:hypothetical protein